ncbi:MAG: sulfotransferase domain-containing protein [Deltaproteobacteria bacterium]|nr:sulfotransferase domain-containing protein [Deltaproteobacteria bacterium]
MFAIVRSVLRNAGMKAQRFAVLALASPLPAERRRSLERRLRGREQVRKLEAADVVIVSYGKAGRTWLRVLLSRLYQLLYGLPEVLLGFDNLHARDRRVPKVFFTHDNYVQDYTGHRDKRAFRGKKVILLVRNPQDVAVSQYFQWKFRMRRAKKALNDYPEHGQDLSTYDFVMRPASGIAKIIDWMNGWAAEVGQVPSLLLVRYEDLRADTVGELRRIATFMGAPADEAALQGAVEYASIENMRKLETQRKFWLSGGRMTPRDRDDPNSYKVRRAKVGGYRDYFDDEQVARIDEQVREKLSPVFGYGAGREGAGA